MQTWYLKIPLRTFAQSPSITSFLPNTITGLNCCLFKLFKEVLLPTYSRLSLFICSVTFHVSCNIKHQEIIKFNRVYEANGMIYSLVSKFRCHKEKSCFQHTHGSSHRNSIKILQSDLCYLKESRKLEWLSALAEGVQSSSGDQSTFPHLGKQVVAFVMDANGSRSSSLIRFGFKLTIQTQLAFWMPAQTFLLYLGNYFAIKKIGFWIEFKEKRHDDVQHS